MKITLISVCLLGLLCSSSAFELNYDNCVQPLYNMANRVYFRFTGIMRIFRLTSEPDPQIGSYKCATQDGRYGCCASKSVDFSYKLTTLAMNNDQDQDGVVEAAEVEHDVSTRYDANKDGIWTEQECVEYNACAFGDTTLMSTYTCNILFRNLGKEGNASISYVASFPPLQRRRKCGAVCLIFCGNGNVLDAQGCPTCRCREQSVQCPPVDDSKCEYGQEVEANGCPTGRCLARGGFDTEDFVASNRARYAEFKNKKCLNKCISTEEKLALNANNNDYNGDQLVTQEDIRYDLAEFYDADKDNFVTKEEFVARWICNYGDSTDYARWLWTEFGFEALGRIDVLNLPDLVGNGVPKADFAAGNRERYARYEALTQGQRKTLCQDAQAGCARRGISIDEKVDIDIAFTDVNKDGVVTREETIHDLEEFYDINGDGVWTQRECENRVACRFGDSTPTATQVCLILVGTSANRTVKEMSDNMADTTPVDVWRQGYRSIYQGIAASGCTERCLSVEERVDKNAANNDGNGDGIINNDDIRADLRANYDKDGDNIVTREEFVRAWTCLYGTCAAFANYRWYLLNGDNDSRDLNNLPPEFDAGIPIADWKALTLEAYTSFYEKNPNAALDRWCRD